MDYKESIEWLYGFKRHGSKLGLERISIIMNKLNNPQNNLKIIHITGTNGKGSVCKFIASILQNAGYSVGVYISPHLERFSERFMINNDEISDDDIIILTKKIKPIIDEMIKNKNPPTFFEIITAMAFLFFSNKNVDFSVIEVGLGGRYDATNIVIPIISIITNISLEHTIQLGEDVRSIAYEKGGIIKDNVQVITAVSGDAKDVIGSISKEKNASVIYIDKKNWRRISYNSSNQIFIIKGLLNSYNVKTSMLGKFQGENITISIAAVEHLQMTGVYLTDYDIVNGVSQAFNPGRMEYISKESNILLDGAHNPAGFLMLKNTLENDLKFERLIFIIGILDDKDIEKMISKIIPISDFIIATKSKNARSCKPNIIKEKIKKIDISKDVVVKNSVKNAIDYSKTISNQNDLICVSGSLYIVGEARSYITRYNKKVKVL